MKYGARIDATNPNFKNAGWKVCEHCGNDYHSYNKTRRFCSKSCAGHSPASQAQWIKPGQALPRRVTTPKLGRRCVCKVCQLEFRSPSKVQYCSAHQAERRSAMGGPGIKRGLGSLENRTCVQCSATFQAYPSSRKKYCTYQCHLNSGGAQRAGKAAGTMTRKYGAKKDANHSEILNAFKKLGSAVLDMSAMGHGVPDLCVWCKDRWHLVDIKNPNTGYGKRGLNARQKEWALGWKGGPVYLISTVDEVARMVAGDMATLKRFPE